MSNIADYWLHKARSADASAQAYEHLAEGANHEANALRAWPVVGAEDLSAGYECAAIEYSRLAETFRAMSADWMAKHKREAGK